MKKLMAVIAAAAVALTLVGCANFGDAKTSGTKWTKKFKLDATGEIKDADGNAATYARAFSALSTSKKCSAIETTITLPVADAANIPISTTVNPNTKKNYMAVVGLAFDVSLTKKDDGKEYYDFVLVGVKPGDGGYYVEHYTDVPKDNLKESMNTSDGTMGGKYTAVAKEGADGWAGTITPYESAEKVATDGYKWTVKVTQATAGSFVVSLNGKEVATYTRELTDDEKADTKNGKAYGQVFVYGNAPIGTKIDATFTTNKDKAATVGLFADEDEF